MQIVSIRSGLVGLAVAAMATTLAPGALAFGGEDIRYGRPWHHLDMTLRALAGDEEAEAGVPEDVFDGAGFDRQAAMSVAWHADYIDSYLYNPIWWLQGAPGSRRFKASISQFDHLAAMHHDDTFTNEGLADNWKRYTAGLLIGLRWAADRNDVAAGHNLLGIASHAVQDFYSHTNWIDDPQRRQSTWLEKAPSTRTGYSLYSGAYEHPQSQAPHHHGAYSLSCSVIEHVNLKDSLETLCGGYSPMQNTSLCTTYRDCRGATEVSMSGSDINLDGVVYLQPTGIAVDTTRIAIVGAGERGLVNSAGAFLQGKGEPNMTLAQCNAVVNFGVTCDHDARGETCTKPANTRTCERDVDFLFADAKMLATRSTTQYMKLVERSMRFMDPRRSCTDDELRRANCSDKYETYWHQLKTRPSSMSQRTRQFENFAQLPFQFMSAGSYPVRNAATSHAPYVASSDGWFLRVRIKTSDDRLSGTDADIKLEVEGPGYRRAELLDYLPTSDAEGHVDNRFLVYNDFEQGDNDVYTIGPFPARPTRVTLINESANAGEVAGALWDDFKRGIRNKLTDTRRLLISIIGGNADLVGDAEQYYSHAELKAIIEGGRQGFSMEVDGGDEGRYRVKVLYEMSTAGLTSDERADGWKVFKFTLAELRCLEESTWDRGSNSDEPFFFFSVAPLNGVPGEQVKTYRAGPFSDVDDGERRNLTGADRVMAVKVPPHGGMALAMQLFESDNENSGDRNQLYTTFKTGVDEETRRGNGRFLDSVGRAVAEDWKVVEMEVTPFKRAAVPQMAPSKTFTNIGWIEGKERKSFTLPTGATYEVLPSNTSMKDVTTWFVNTNPLLVDGNIRDRIAKNPGELQLPVNPGAQPPVLDPDAIKKTPGLPKGTIGSNTVIDKENLGTISNGRLGQVGNLSIALWQGSWSSNFGPLRFQQTGDSVVGDYADRGRMTGTIQPGTNILAGEFANGNRTGEFRFELNGSEFTGKWKWKGEKTWRGEWTGKKTDSAKPVLKNK